MSLVAKLSVKPLLYAIGMLLVVVAGLSTALFVQGGRVDVATAARDTARADQRTTVTEREAWKARASEVSAANTAYGVALSQLQAELTRAQEQATRVRAQAAHAQEVAQKETADAERTLHEFVTRYQVQSHVSDCARALDQVEAVCPAFEHY